jgi:hypothetical protein
LALYETGQKAGNNKIPLTKCGGLMSLKSMTIKPVLKEANIVASILAKHGLIRDIKILAWL